MNWREFVTWPVQMICELADNLLSLQVYQRKKGTNVMLWNIMQINK